MTTADDDARMPDVSREPRRHHDPLAVRTVFVAPRRANRPTDVGATDASSPLDCPFCSGNEALTPPDVLRMPADPGQLWHARLIPNRFPVVEEFADGPLGAAADSIARLAHGVHDVVIESRSHARSIL